jgi:hypothetical protein
MTGDDLSALRADLAEIKQALKMIVEHFGIRPRGRVSLLDLERKAERKVAEIKRRETA